MKLASRIVTGLAVLGLAVPVLAAETTPASQPAPVAQTHRQHHARKVAQSTEKKAEPKKAEKKGAAKAEKAPAKAEKAPAAGEKAPAKAEPAAQPAK